MSQERCQNCPQHCLMTARRCDETVKRMEQAQDPALVSFIPRSTPPSHDRRG